MRRPKEKERMQDEVIKPKLPYPQKFMRHKLNEQFGKFIEMLKQIHLSIPFTDVFQQMPNYSKFLKEILSGKRECNVVDSMSVGECYSALIHNDLPPKMKDPGNFSILCNINGKLFQNAVCDLGASVSIMQYSVLKKLKLGELLQTNMTLQFVDRSIKFPKDRVEDVPLKIREFAIPVDFIVLEIAEDDNIPIILGRPFLATSGALIDVKGGIITLCVGIDKASFNLKSMHESLSYVQEIMCINSFPLNDDSCMFVSSTNDILVACDDTPKCVESKIVSEEDKESSKLENEFEMTSWFELSLKDDENSFSSVGHVELKTPRKKKSRKKKRVPNARKRKRS
ncbi:uncharacterized protein LOC110716414 [Chenopodium quinoa]|uniref:uncharacterized protein LOC110716414 n=1 Tax=Chenopodium quinoa TaxID=63459 RepID=UPI000B791746|nr:uncharacterized protein LOC110716414 [Chenopodium quinoa]